MDIHESLPPLPLKKKRKQERRDTTTPFLSLTLFPTSTNTPLLQRPKTKKKRKKGTQHPHHEPRKPIASPKRSSHNPSPQIRLFFPILFSPITTTTTTTTASPRSRPHPNSSSLQIPMQIPRIPAFRFSPPFRSILPVRRSRGRCVFKFTSSRKDDCA